MPLQKIFFALVFVLSVLAGASQEYPETDSLQRELQKFEAHKKLPGVTATPLTDTTKANIWYELVSAYGYSDSDLGMFYAQKCLSLSQKIGYKKGIGNGYNGMGLIFLYKHNPGQAIIYFGMALKIRMEINDRIGMAWTYNNLGMAYGDEGNYPLSIMNHTNALKIREATGDKKMAETSFSKRGSAYEMLGDYPNAMNDYLNALKAAEETGTKMRVAEDYRIIADIYDKIGNYAEAMKNYHKSSEMAIEIGNKAYIAVAYLNLGEVCYKQNDYAGALKNYLYSLKIREKNKLNDYEIAYIYNKIGQLFFIQGKYNEGLKYCFHALQFYEKINARYEMAFSYNLLGNIYEKQGNQVQALMYETKSLATAEKADARDIKKRAYESLARLNAALKNYKAAYDNEVLFKQEYDTIYNKENERKVTGLQMQYEFNKQHDSSRAVQSKLDVIALQEIQKQKAYTGMGVTALILVVALLFFVYRNYTNQRKATAEMAAAMWRAEQSEKFKERFLANMSHEIRTPMNAVLGMSTLVLDTPLNEKQKKYIIGIKKSSEDLLVILNDILDLSKLEAGKMELEKQPFRPRDQVSHTLDIMRFKAEEKSLLFAAKVNEDVPAVIIGDSSRLNQILLNLLGNAIKFTSKGSVNLSVKSGRGPTDKQVILHFSVKDTGIGMNLEQQKKIFESFVQGDTDTSRKYGGTGLGLSITKTLIELHGGKIQVNSSPGTGSNFSFDLPYSIGNESEIVGLEYKEETNYPALSGLKLLIAEDNELNQVVIKDTLENLVPGINIALASNGKIAVEMMRQGNYDMVLMDVHMPEMDGYEATRFIRNTLKIDIPIVALTASVIRGDLDKCTEAGMNGYIPKPFKRSELLNELMKHLPHQNG
jgi:signal transduction histidine kinase/CheY-like chemotaxis protein